MNLYATLYNASGTETLLLFEPNGEEVEEDGDGAFVLEEFIVALLGSVRLALEGEVDAPVPTDFLFGVIAALVSH